VDLAGDRRTGFDEIDVAYEVALAIVIADLILLGAMIGGVGIAARMFRASRWPSARAAVAGSTALSPQPESSARAKRARAGAVQRRFPPAVG
jgi:hypothetical protein